MFQNHFESEDPSTINLSQASSTQQTNCKFQCNSVLIFIMLGFVFLIMGMIELITNYQELQYRLPLNYDKNNNKITCASTYVTFGTDDTVSIYLDFQKITQMSLTTKFDGEDIQQFDEYSSNCNAYRYNKQTFKTISITNTTLNPNSYSIPCGKFPSMFIGTHINLVLGNGSRLPLSYSGINVFNYKAHDLNTNLQWTSLEHPLFQNWIEQNVFINTHKLIGKVNGRFQGNVYLEILQLNDFPNDFGPMVVYLTNNKAVGGSNQFFCIINFMQSGLMFVFALFVYLYQKIMREEIKSANAIGERKIELKGTYQSQSGKIQF